jgi:phosphodiesterase/alkaline phosphatase D-like protein
LAVNRIVFVTVVCFFASALDYGGSAQEELPYSAQGELVGEVTCDSAIVRTRLTLRPERNPITDLWKAEGSLWVPWSPDICEGVPGKEGLVRLHYGTGPHLADAQATAWAKAEKERDCSVQFKLNGLKPATTYYYRVEMASRKGEEARRSGEVGSFKTAPPPDAFLPVRFTVTTGQAMRSRDIFREDKPWGFKTYEAIARRKPDFHVSTGDSVYYDQDYALATDVELARYHWHRMYSLPCVRNLFRSTPGYWEKDDHDYRWNDCDPHQKVPQKLAVGVSTITDELGQRLFREAVPMSEKTYRTFVWGKGLQIWLTEGRDYRSPNSMPDGPDKTMWGAEQKEWLKKGLKGSRCHFKVLISPTPLIGPDREEKRDNHANRNGFWTEGREFLRGAKESGLKNFYIICGDRHWQYHSIDESGIEEFSCGATSDRHAARGQPHWGKDRQPHFRDAKGGFLLVEVRQVSSGRELRFTFCDVDGDPVYICRRDYRNEN